MVRASVRNITLSIFKGLKYDSNKNKKFKHLMKKGKDEKINEFICRFPFALFFFHLCCYLKDLWIDMDNIINNETFKTLNF